MEPIGLGLVLLSAAGSALWTAHRERRRQSAEERLRRDLYEADLKVGRAFRQARQDMNDAAGQSWRNLAG